MTVIPAPVFTGVNSSRNPAISGSYEDTEHRFSPVRRLFTKPSLIAEASCLGKISEINSQTSVCKNLTNAAIGKKLRVY
jgi:hypothetical protein